MESVTIARKFIAVLMSTVLLMSAFTPVRADSVPSWDSLIELAADAAIAYEQEYRGSIFRYTLFDIDADGIPELMLSPQGGTGGSFKPVFVYRDGQYEYLCSLYLGFNCAYSYYQDDDGFSLIVEHEGGPLYSYKVSTSRLFLYPEGIYEKLCQVWDIWEQDGETGNYIKTGTVPSFSQGMNEDDAEIGYFGGTSVKTENPDNLYREWFLEGRLSSAPAAEIGIQEYSYAGERTLAVEDYFMNHPDFIRAILRELGQEFKAQADKNPITGPDDQIPMSLVFAVLACGIAVYTERRSKDAK